MNISNIQVYWWVILVWLGLIGLALAWDHYQYRRRIKRINDEARIKFEKIVNQEDWR